MKLIFLNKGCTAVVHTLQNIRANSQCIVMIWQFATRQCNFGLGDTHINCRKLMNVSVFYARWEDHLHTSPPLVPNPPFMGALQLQYATIFFYIFVCLNNLLGAICLTDLDHLVHDRVITIDFPPVLIKLSIGLPSTSQQGIQSPRKNAGWSTNLASVQLDYTLC